MSEKNLCPNPEDIKKFFDLITQQWRSQEVENCLFEVRCLGENKKPLSQKFSYKKIPDAVEFAKGMNEQKYNVYTTVNPINPNVEKNARDENVSLAFFSFADADDLAGVEALKKFCESQKPDFVVITGNTPHLRAHTYWRLDQPCADMEVWRETQQRLASNFKTDPSVINPSRIMRVPGTISYPSGKKRAQGYIDELVVLSINPKPIPFADISSWSNFLQKPARSETIDIDLGKNSLDLNALKEAILSGQNWHDNMLRLVGRLVADGSSKEEILGLAAEFTLAGYSEQQTRNELAPMIDGALAKGFDKKLTKHKNRDLGQSLKGIANAQNIYELLIESGWSEALAYDEFAKRKLLIKKPPDQTGNPAHFKDRELQDHDYTKIVRWINRNGFPRVSKHVVVDVVNELCREQIIAPVRHYLEDLQFDANKDTPQLSSWMINYLGVKPENEEERKYIEAVSRLSLIQVVARIFQPGCKADSLPVLEGEQGLGKSTAIRVLHGQKFFGDALPPMGTKDASDYVRGKWGIELSELAFQRKADEEAQKAFISRQEERFRPAYGREEIRYPRQCVFWGTTNRSDYLTDDSGNRRFLPIRTETINIPALRTNRDKLWAEAVHCYSQGEKWWLDDILLKYAQKQTEKRLESDPWMEQVLLNTLERSEITIKEAFALCFPEKEVDKISQADSRRMSRCLLKTGWCKAGQYTGGPKRNQTKFVRITDK